MAEISKLSGVAIADVAAVDAVLKANIANILGLTLPSAVGTPAAAYSVRLLGSAVGISSYTGPCMRVRRDTAGGTGDDDEADVSFDSNNELSLDSAISNASAGVTATTLGQFLNVGTVSGTTYTNPDSLTVTASCFVDEWKDQAGSNDATQATQGSQPQIHDGTVDTDLIKENGKPAIEFDGSNDFFASVSAYPTGTNESHFMVRNAQAIDRRVACTRGTGAAGTVQGWHHKSWAGDYAMVDDGSGNSILISNTTPKSGQLLRSAFLSQSAISIFDDGSSYGSASGSVGSFNSGRTLHLGTNANFQNNQFFFGNMQELIFWNTDQSSNRTGIETDINTYFSIT